MKEKGSIRSRQSLWESMSGKQRFGICDLVPGNLVKYKKELRMISYLWNRVSKDRKSVSLHQSKVIDYRKEKGIRNLLAVDSGGHDY